MKEQSQIRILTIVVTFNAVPWLERCLSSVAKSVLMSDIILIDNASTDSTVSQVERFFPDVILVKNDSNLGFGAANNIGLNYAIEHGYDYALLLNQDAWIDVDMLPKLIKAHLENPEKWGILSPVHLDTSHSAVEHGFATYSGLKTIPESSDVPVELDFINAAIWLLPVSAVTRVGLFSPLFYHYGEDKDYCNRMKYAGYSIGYVAGAYAVHAREHKPVPEEKKYRVESVYALSEYANPNYTLAKAFVHAVLGQIKKIFVRPVVSRSSHIAIAMWLIGQTSKVLKQRKQSCQR